ncbi:hypothetical protein [Haloferax volcanii]|uniref:hypothetical protein n=1 Tax=Haloferax volcanii TaxID=2246 RepID=UPI0038531046
MSTTAQSIEQLLNLDETEPLDPALDNSGTIHESRLSTRLGAECHRKNVPSDYVSDEGQYLKSWKQARRAYKRHRIGEFHSPMQTTLHRRSRQDYRRFLESDRQLQGVYQDFTTALISLRVPPLFNGTYLPPLITLDSLMDAMPPVMDALRYRLRGHEYEYARVVAGTDHFATPHIHIYIWIDGKPTFEQLEPVVVKFVEKCSLAPDDGRGNRAREGALTLQYEQEITDRGETTGSRYIATQLPHIGNVTQIGEPSLDWGTVAHATSRQLVGCSYMSRNGIE